MVIEGRYFVQVRLNGYSNPTGKCGHGPERCDSYFHYCLKPLGDVEFTCCPGEFRIISQANEDDESNIDFSLSTVLGLSNPQNLSGLGDTYEVSY